MITVTRHSPPQLLRASPRPLRAHIPQQAQCHQGTGQSCSHPALPQGPVGHHRVFYAPLRKYANLMRALSRFSSPPPPSSRPQWAHQPNLPIKRQLGSSECAGEAVLFSADCSFPRALGFDEAFTLEPNRSPVTQRQHAMGQVNFFGRPPFLERVVGRPAHDGGLRSQAAKALTLPVSLGVWP